MTRRRFWLLAASVLAVALAASANGLPNGFTYDDRYIILMNDVVHSLRNWRHIITSSYWPPQWGGDGYRPLTVLSFAAEWSIGHGAPWIFHAVNVLLYGATSVAVFWLASMLLPPVAAWVAAALFAVHPVHVEAVANIVGQAELVVALALIVAVALYVRGRRRGTLTPWTIAGICALYATACVAKENGIVLPALLAAAEWTVIQDERPLRQRLFRALRPFYLGLVAVAALFLLARSVALPRDLAGFQPFVAFQVLHLTNTQRILTMFGIVPHWVRLFLWPAHLSAEYAPPYIDVAQGPELVQLPGLLLLIGILGLAFAVRRKQPVVAFGIAWICVTLLPASNFIVPTGILLAERTLFLPSCGAMLVVGACVPLVRGVISTRAVRLAGAGTLAAVIAAGMWRSYERSAVWRSNYTLFEQTVRDAPLTYRSHYQLGLLDFFEGRNRQGEAELRTAIRLFPYDPFMLINLAELYRRANACNLALPLYRAAYVLMPNLPVGHGPYSDCLVRTGNFEEARRQVAAAYRYGGGLANVRRVLAGASKGMRERQHADSARARPAPATPVKQSGKVR